MNGVHTKKPPDFVWPRNSLGYYNRVNPMAIFDGSILSGYETGEIEDMYGKRGAMLIVKYLEQEDIQLGEIDNVVDVNAVKERYGLLNGKALIESRKKIDFIRNRVKVIEVATRNTIKERKEASFHHMYLSCDCQDNFYQSWYKVATEEVMRDFNDFRKPYDTPAPRIIMDLCVHGNATLNILADKKNAESFDMWGNHGHAVQIFKNNLDIVLDETLPRLRRDEFFSFYTDLFNPWRKRLGLKKVKPIA